MLPEIESLERQSLENDQARYLRLTARVARLPIDCAEHFETWNEIEQIKNRHGGMPPEKEV